MLNKLLKYDNKHMLKQLSVFYIAMIFTSVLTRIFLNVKNSFFINLLGKIFVSVLICLIISVLINNIIKAWVRFKLNIYGDESYLTHTLPVTKKTLYNSKILSTILLLVVSFIIIIISLFIAFYSKENLDILTYFLNSMVQIYKTNTITLLLVFFLVFFLEILNCVQAGYTGIILGHKMNNNKTVYSILFGFITYNFLQLLLIACLYIISLFNADIMNLFVTKNVIDISMLKLILCLSIVLYTVSFIINYFLNIKLFKKGVNVD